MMLGMVQAALHHTHEVTTDPNFKVALLMFLVMVVVVVIMEVQWEGAGPHMSIHLLQP
jgi:hypothetical protein